MTIAKKEILKPGSVVTQAEINSSYDILDNASNNIDDSNTAVNWATRRHIQVSTGNKFNEFESDKVTSETGWLSSTVWTNVPGINVLQVTVNDIGDTGSIIRCHTSGIVTKMSLGSGFVQGTLNYFAFRILVTSTTGSTPVCVGGYSFTSRSLVTEESSGSGGRLQYSPFNISGLWVPDIDHGLVTIALQYKIHPNVDTNKIKLDNFNLSTIKVRQ